MRALIKTCRVYRRQGLNWAWKAADDLWCFSAAANQTSASLKRKDDRPLPKHAHAVLHAQLHLGTQAEAASDTSGLTSWTLRWLTSKCEAADRVGHVWEISFTNGCHQPRKTSCDQSNCCFSFKKKCCFYLVLVLFLNHWWANQATVKY